MNTMLLQHFGLREQPFAVTPDPRYLYESETHREALASLVYGINSERGFLALIGKPGMGKTTLLFRLLEHYRHRALTAFLFQTQCEWREFLSYLFADLGIQCADPNDLVTMHQRLNRTLGEQARRGRSCLVVIDEAQNLDSRALETVRLLSDFETSRTKLLQIVLAGQPAFEDKLAEPSMLQLRQRISMLCRLSPLGEQEVNDYIDHRLRMAGHSGAALFTADSRTRIFQLSEGIPRVIGNICFNSMSLAFATQQRLITAELVNEVGADLELKSHTPVPAAGPAPGVTAAEEVGSATRRHVEDSSAYRLHISEAPGDKLSHAAQSGDPESSARSALSAPTGTAAIAPDRTEVRHRRSSRKRRRPLRVLERTVIAMAAAAAVVALAMWLFAHRTLGSDRLPGTPRPTRPTAADGKGRAPQKNRAEEQPEASALAHSPGPSFRNSLYIARGRDTDSERLSPKIDITQSARVFRRPDPKARGLSQGQLPAPVPPASLSASANPALTRVAAVTPKPALPELRTSNDPPQVVPGTVLRIVKPEYPEAARLALIQGVVTLQALVDTDGQVKQVQILEGDPALTNAAVQAVRRWQYNPYREGGSPTTFRTIIKIRFALDHPPAS